METVSLIVNHLKAHLIVIIFGIKKANFQSFSFQSSLTHTLNYYHAFYVSHSQ